MADTYKAVQCPACHKLMKKIFIPSAGINIDVCDESCGGVFFDNQELQSFNKDSDDILEVNKALEGKDFISVDETQTRVCPACSKNMVKTNIKGLGVELDTCYSCGGVFLDNGELDLIKQGVKKTTVSEVKAQNSTLEDDIVETPLREVQQEDALKKRNDMITRAIFGRFSYGRWNHRRPGLIDLLWEAFRR